MTVPIEGNPTEASVSNGTQNGVSKFWTFRMVGQLLGRSWEAIEKLHMPSVISEEPKEEVTTNVDAAEGDSEPDPAAELVEGPIVVTSPVSLIAPHLAWRRQALLLQEGLHVAAVHIASLLGCEEGGWENFDFEALEEQVEFTLHGLLQGLEACNLRLERLYVDFDCLDDGAAEGLFGSEGMLKEELQEIQEVQGDCAELQKRTSGWLRCSDRATGHVVGLEALADFLEEAVPEMDRLVSCCGDFAARRRAAVARAKAAIETADAEERASAVGLLQEALSPSSRVDFPRITEICQRVADRPDEAEQSAAMLWAALSSTEGHAEAPRRQLKALTIAHELLYDERVLFCFTEQDTAPLQGLESSRPGTLGRAAEEAMRMLAAEVRRRVEEAREKRGTRRHLTWSFTLRLGGDGKSPGSSPTAPTTTSRLRSSKSMPLEQHGVLLSGAKLECSRIFTTDLEAQLFKMAGARLHFLHGPGGAPWIGGGFEDTINEFLTYREALMMRLRLTLLAGRPDLPVHLEQRRGAQEGLLEVQDGHLVKPTTTSPRIPLLMSDIVYESVPTDLRHLGDYIMAVAPRGPMLRLGAQKEFEEFLSQLSNAGALRWDAMDVLSQNWRLLHLPKIQLPQQLFVMTAKTMLVRSVLASCLVPAICWGHGGGGGHAGHSYSSHGWHGYGGGGGSGDTSNVDRWVWLVLAMIIALSCVRYAVVRAYSGDSHHGYLVVPPLFCERARVMIPCAGPDKSHTYYPGDQLAVLSNGIYARAAFVRVDDQYFPPKAIFQSFQSAVEECAHGLPLLHVETGESGHETWLLSAPEMYDCHCQHCKVAPPDYIGFAPAKLQDILQNLRTQVAAPVPAPVPVQPKEPGGCRIA
eukprot:s1855_g9.t1